MPSLILKKSTKTEHAWKLVPETDVTSTAIAFNGQTYDRTATPAGTVKPTRRTRNGLPARSGQVWVEFVRRRYMVMSLVEAVYDPETRRQKQHHRAQVLSVNIAHRDNPVYTDLIEKKRASAHLAIDAYIIDRHRAKAMHHAVDAELPRYSRTATDDATETFRRERFELYRARGMSATSAGAASDRDVGKVRG